MSESHRSIESSFNMARLHLCLSYDKTAHCTSDYVMGSLTSGTVLGGRTLLSSDLRLFCGLNLDRLLQNDLEP